LAGGYSCENVKQKLWPLTLLGTKDRCLNVVFVPGFGTRADNDLAPFLAGEEYNEARMRLMVHDLTLAATEDVSAALDKLQGMGVPKREIRLCRKNVKDQSIMELDKVRPNGRRDVLLYIHHPTSPMQRLLLDPKWHNALVPKQPVKPWTALPRAWLRRVASGGHKVYRYVWPLATAALPVAAVAAASEVAPSQETTTDTTSTNTTTTALTGSDEVRLRIGDPIGEDGEGPRLAVGAEVRLTVSCLQARTGARS
jgi:hypothetical protein